MKISIGQELGRWFGPELRGRISLLNSISNRGLMESSHRMILNERRHYSRNELGSMKISARNIGKNPGMEKKAELWLKSIKEMGSDPFPLH